MMKTQKQGGAKLNVLKNGKLYSVEEDEFSWKIIFRKSGSVIVFKFGKKDFRNADDVKNYVKRCAQF